MSETRKTPTEDKDRQIDKVKNSSAMHIFCVFVLLDQLAVLDRDPLVSPFDAPGPERWL